MRSAIKGSYCQLKDKKDKTPIPNLWRIQLYTGFDDDGKRKRHTETIKGSEVDVKRRLKELSAQKEKGIALPTGRLTVA